ncbi:hypothetical protein CRE_29861 [Caenorhabditis remanei]|uniref:Uncharacterized protein n=1 Tax=Caenorhabditis remanei TaxID=31234 RepID=E3LUW7_CAERE|nr:hypothetical protein CRE_29861 [Caenorhabditis remanei]
MDEKVSEGERSMKTSSQSSSSSVNTSDVDALGQRTDHLIYNCYEFEKSTNSLNEYRHWIKEKETANVEVLEKALSSILDLGESFGKLGPKMDKDIEDSLAWLFAKVGWRPTNIMHPNIGYAGYEDMLLRYCDLKKELDKMRVINLRASNIRTQVVQQQLETRQMNDKLDELRYRWKFLTVTKTIASRNLGYNDGLSMLFSLPILLPGIIFHEKTSHTYAYSLLDIFKRLLVVAEAIQYERSPTNDPIVTNSNILYHLSQPSVPSLYVPIQYADSNGEVTAPEEKILPVARDSAHTLIASENGEVHAPENSILPIARDSALSLVSSENGEVSATSEYNMPIAKDSATTLGSNESPKPLSKTQLTSGVEVKRYTNSIKSQRRG